MKTATTVAAILMVASPAMAKPNCTSSLCAYDRNNQLVGTVLQTQQLSCQQPGCNNYEGVLVRFYGLKPYIINFNTAGLVPNLVFQYTTADCTGTQYLSTFGGLPDEAYSDGLGRLWSDGPTPAIQRLIINSRLEHSIDPATNELKIECVSGTPYQANVTEAVVLDSQANRFMPPLLVR